MTKSLRIQNSMEILLAARKIADFATAEGIEIRALRRRVTYNHLGAVLADAILQAGLNYTTVVLPRINNILQNHSDATSSSALLDIVINNKTSSFLQWSHPEKILRFNNLVHCIDHYKINDINTLKIRLEQNQFQSCLLNIHGIGPKTVDYMGCLIGVESIAVDRHIRTFAKLVDIHENDYNYLKKIFCFAADLLSISRRDFDAWVWQKMSTPNSKQLSFDI